MHAAECGYAAGRLKMILTYSGSFLVAVVSASLLDANGSAIQVAAVHGIQSLHAVVVVDERDEAETTARRAR